MKKKLSLLCLLCLMAFCCSCGKEEANNKQSEKSTGKKSDEVISAENESETEDESVKKPDEEKMRKDLEEKQCNTISFSEWEGTITVPIVNFTLDKAKDNEDSYVAYCTLELKDETYSGKITYSLTYGYYDIGGWVLDDVKEENRELQATSYPQEQFVCDYIKKEDVNAGKMEVAEFRDGYALENGSAWTYYLTKRCATEYVDYYYSDSIVCTFDSAKGWLFSEYASYYAYQEWTRIVGTKWYSVDGTREYYFTIKKFDLVSLKVTLDVEAYNPVGWHYVYDDEYGEWEEDRIYSYNETVTADLRMLNGNHFYTTDTTVDTYFLVPMGDTSDDINLDFSPSFGIECMGYTSYVVTRIE